MKLLQALFFPPEQPGGVSSMIPYLQERFHSSRWEMEMFWSPKRIRNKGQEDPIFHTLIGKSLKECRSGQIPSNLPGLPVVDTSASSKAL